MASRKQKQKKRRKRQIKKEFKQTTKLKQKQKKAIPLISCENQNQLYQRQLDQKYSGQVTAKEKFINYKAVLLHYCSDCDKDFYARPLCLVSEVQPHNCRNYTLVTINKPKRAIS